MYYSTAVCVFFFCVLEQIETMKCDNVFVIGYEMFMLHGVLLHHTLSLFLSFFLYLYSTLLALLSFSPLFLSSFSTLSLPSPPLSPFISPPYLLSVSILSPLSLYSSSPHPSPF